MRIRAEKRENAAKKERVFYDHRKIMSRKGDSFGRNPDNIERNHSFSERGCATVRERERQRRRERQEAWDRRNLRTVSTHLTRQEADALDVICCMNRVTKYDLLHGFLLDYLEENGVPVRRWKKEGQRWP